MRVSPSSLKIKSEKHIVQKHSLCPLSMCISKVLTSCISSPHHKAHHKACHFTVIEDLCKMLTASCCSHSDLHSRQIRDWQWMQNECWTQVYSGHKKRPKLRRGQLLDWVQPIWLLGVPFFDEFAEMQSFLSTLYSTIAMNANSRQTNLSLFYILHIWNLISHCIALLIVWSNSSDLAFCQVVESHTHLEIHLLTRSKEEFTIKRNRKSFWRNAVTLVNDFLSTTCPLPSVATTYDEPLLPN